MVPPSPLSRSAIPITLTDSASASYDTPISSHLAIAALFARSASSFASTLATSHLPTKASLTVPASTPHSTAAPPRTTSWYSEPNTRGTWQLLITYLITINLCVWTAVHLNIAAKIDKGQHLRERLWSNYYCRRARWVLLGLLAPELVVYTAWMQWESARVFVKKVNKYRRNNLQKGVAMSQKSHDEPTNRVHAEDAATPGELHEMTTTHGFYAGMGSYYIDLDVHDEPEPSQLYQSLIQDPDGYSKRRGSQRSEGEDHWRTPEYLSMVKEFYASIGRRRSPKRLYLTAKGVLALVEAGKLSLPSKEAIADRSKSDVLAKTLVCLQAGYIIVQSLSRLASGLPLTFLEINTLGHVLCALMMYTFWFHKPQDLGLSIALEADLARELGNWHRSIYDIGFIADFCSIYKVVWERAKTTRSSKTLSLQGTPPTSIPNTAVPRREPSVFKGYPKESDVAILNGDDCVLVLNVYGLDDVPFEDMAKRMSSSDTWNIFTAVYCVDYFETRPEYLNDNPRVHFCSVFWSGIQKFESGIRQLLETNTEPFEYRPWHLEEGIPNWPSSGLLSGRTSLPPLAIAISTALYGGLHGAAWHSFFPTEIEKWFWRVSSIVIAGSGLVFAYGMTAYGFYYRLSPDQYRSFVRALARPLNWVLQVSSVDLDGWRYTSRFRQALIICLCTLCVIARLFLVVESFISLRKVPIEVYQTPDWTQWIPHL
jgi:hypothetical protein